MSAGVLLVSVVAVCAVLCGAAAAPARDNSPCRSPVSPYQIVDCAVILELAEILNEARLQERARVIAQELGKPSEFDDAHMQHRAQAHAEQIGGGGASSSSSSSSTTKCYMGSYPYSEIPCDQMEVQSNEDKDEQVVREYAELMKDFENAHMQQRAQAHAEQIGGGGASSSSSSSSTTKCYMGSYPYSEIPCDQMEVQSNKDKDEQVVREYAELMKNFENAHMQQRTQAHAEQIGGGGASSSSSSTTKCYMGSYPYSEIPCGQMEVQSNKDKDEQAIREYAELMKRLG